MLSCKENNTNMLCFHAPREPCWGTGYQDQSFSRGKRARDSVLCMFGVRFLLTAQGWALMLVRKYLASTVMQITFFLAECWTSHIRSTPKYFTVNVFCVLHPPILTVYKVLVKLYLLSRTTSPLPFLCFTPKGHLGQMENLVCLMKLSSSFLQLHFLHWNFQPYLELKHGFNQF